MNTNQKIKKALMVFGICIAFSSCEYNVENEDGPIEIDLCDPAISFATQVKPIIDNNCITCHGGNQAPDLRTFAGISANAERVKDQVTTRRMPLGGSLSNEQIETIRCWVENGGLNN
ncbi:c-type cytochrome [Aquimarina aggregata]|uniref:c-type cytochrome n=1 Tax=Aquimarina aggregata TaxID=1642818 RepID=UPI0024927E9A|nr:cytochrome c [Aquimarina aggregata]